MHRRNRRIEAGALCHIFNRGHSKQPIFRTDDDYAYLLALLRKFAVVHGVELHAYALMTNHFHVVARPLARTLTPFVQDCLRSYATRFNSNNGRLGALFQGRFGARSLGSDERPARLIRYVIRNPVAAGIAGSVAAYRWCSAHDLLRPSPSSRAEVSRLDELIGRWASSSRVGRLERRAFLDWCDRPQPTLDADIAAAEGSYGLAAIHLVLGARRVQRMIADLRAQEPKASWSRGRYCGWSVLEADVLVRSLGLRGEDVSRRLDLGKRTVYRLAERGRELTMPPDDSDYGRIRSKVVRSCLPFDSAELSLRDTVEK